MYFLFMVSCYISQKTPFDFRRGILSSEFLEMIRSPQRLVDRIKLFTRCLWDLADVALWGHRGHFAVQTELKLSNHTWNWEQRNQVTASQVYSLRWGAKPSLHAGQKSLRMKLHLQVGIFLLGYTFTAIDILRVWLHVSLWWNLWHYITVSHIFDKHKPAKQGTNDFLAGF